MTRVGSKVQTSAPLVAWIALGLFYILTAAGNRSEADDAFAFAQAVEHASLRDLVSAAHTPHLLFLPFWRSLYGATSTVGPTWRAYDVMRLANSFIGAGAVLLLFALLRRRFGTSTLSAAAAAGCFGASYGFWRYANEGDAYPLGALMVLAYCWLAFDEQAGPRKAAIAGLAAAAAALIHILGFIPALTVAPIVYLSARHVRSLVVYAATFGGVFLAVTLSTFLIAGGSTMSYSSYLVGGGISSFSPGGIMKSFVGLVPDLIGANFVFSRADVTSWLERRVPTVDLREEAYAASHFPQALSALALALVAGAFVISIYLLIRSFHGQSKLDAKVVSVVAWILLYWVVVTGRSPAAPESWIPLLTPIWILVGSRVFDRMQGRFARIALVSFVALFALENAIGGIAIVRSPDWDLNARRSSWLIVHASPEDTILSGDGPIFDWFLTYHTTATVVPLGFQDDHQLKAAYAALPGSGTLFAMDTVFTPPPEYFAQEPTDYAHAVDFGQMIRPDFEVAFRDEVVTVYVRSQGG
jgi:hypothetical protein